MEVSQENVSVEKILYIAAKIGDLPTIKTLVQQDPLLVEQVLFARSRNVLHVATMAGREEIVKELLAASPELARDVDDKMSSALHIAAARGHVVIAQELLIAAPEMLWRVDDQGMNPVHVAAAQGHVPVLEVLLENDVSPAMEMLEGRRSVLTLCVKHRRLEALRFLVRRFPKLLHEQDADGETVLSLATKYYNHPEIVEHLFGQGAFKPAITALIRNVTGMTTLLVGLIAGMAFQANLSPPGGVWQDDTELHNAGKAVVAYTDPLLYKLFYRANNVAFISSLLVIFLNTTLASKTSIVYTAIIFFATLVAIGSISVSYATAMVLTNPAEQSSHLIIATVDVVFSGILMVAYAMGALKISYTKWKEQRMQHEDHTITDRIFRAFYQLQL